jgi:hypothetical protein
LQDDRCFAHLKARLDEWSAQKINDGWIVVDNQSFLFAAASDTSCTSSLHPNVVAWFAGSLSTLHGPRDHTQQFRELAVDCIARSRKNQGKKSERWQ